MNHPLGVVVLGLRCEGLGIVPWMSFLVNAGLFFFFKAPLKCLAIKLSFDHIHLLVMNPDGAEATGIVALG